MDSRHPTNPQSDSSSDSDAGYNSDYDSEYQYDSEPDKGDPLFVEEELLRALRDNDDEKTIFDLLKRRPSMLERDVDRLGNTVLHYAVLHNKSPFLLSVLFHKNAKTNQNQKNNADQTPADLAKDKPELLKIITQSITPEKLFCDALLFPEEKTDVDARFVDKKAVEKFICALPPDLFIPILREGLADAHKAEKNPTSATHLLAKLILDQRSATPCRPDAGTWSTLRHFYEKEFAKTPEAVLAKRSREFFELTQGKDVTLTATQVREKYEPLKRFLDVNPTVAESMAFDIFKALNNPMYSVPLSTNRNSVSMVIDYATVATLEAITIFKDTRLNGNSATRDPDFLYLKTEADRLKGLAKKHSAEQIKARVATQSSADVSAMAAPPSPRLSSLSTAAIAAALPAVTVAAPLAETKEEAAPTAEPAAVATTPAVTVTPEPAAPQTPRAVEPEPASVEATAPTTPITAVQRGLQIFGSPAPASATPSPNRTHAVVAPKYGQSPAGPRQSNFS